MASSKKCPMCGTSNDQNAQSCKYCGFLFEDFGNAGIRTSGDRSNPIPPPQQEQPPSINTIPSREDNFGMSTSPTSTGTPLFTVSKSLLGSIVPSIVYLVFILFVTTTTSFSLLSVAFIAIFILISVLPALFTPRKYEFYDSLLRMHKIIGGDSDIPYTSLEVRDYRAGRRPQIALLSAEQKRPIVIPGNPANKELGEDLNQFLSKKLKKSNPQAGDQQQSTLSSDTVGAMNTNDDTDAAYKT